MVLSRDSVKYLLFIILAFLLICYLISFDYDPQQFSIKRYESKSCPIIQFDPWDFSIRHLMKPKKISPTKCDPSFWPRSFLNPDGRLWMNQTDTEKLEERCSYRCIVAISDLNIKADKWKIIEMDGVYPNCDLIQVKCETKSKSTYKYAHLQIVKKESKPKIGSYDVHLIVLDGVSHSHFLRALPDTARYLQTEMNAILFPHLNKVGFNSRPNVYGFMLGEEAEIKLPIMEQRKDYIFRRDKLCNLPMDNLTLFTDFKNNGYRTLFADDWEFGAFLYYNCKGFTDLSFSIDHTLRHFILSTTSWHNLADSESTKNIFKKSCIEKHEYALHLFKQFISKYDKEPKFSLTWLNHFAHDSINKLFEADFMFMDLFEQHKEKLSNSFVFFFGDHGNNIDSITDFPVGVMESNNPFLGLIVPKSLRSNRNLMDQLNANSKKLISHFDLYATLLEIAETSSKWTDSTQFSTQNFSSPTHQLIGSSLFHSMKEPRNCDTLRIPFRYCMCERNFKTVSNSTLSLKIADLVLKKMNKDIKDDGVDDKCVTLEVDQEKTAQGDIELIESPDSQLGWTMVKMTVQVKPSGGKYDIMAEINREGQIKLLSDKFPRRNRYEEQSKCISGTFLRNYCYCKGLI